jgi:lipoprotein-anchoring transpeptidase ErfK/SrfK
VLVEVLVVLVLALPSTAAAAKRSACSNVLGKAAVSGPTNSVSWRAEVFGRTPVYYRLPGKNLKPSRWMGPSDAAWLLVVSHGYVAHNRCWVRLRMPWRPNSEAAWVNANSVSLQLTRWRIAVSTSRRTLTVFHAGRAVRTVQVVVGKPSTPTPTGLFAIVWAVPWHPNDFLGSWVLMLSAHSDVLQQFDGGDGTVGIHGRGGASLIDPLGSARSHGCIRLANDSIDWLVHTIGQSRLPGTPVQVS